MSTNPSVEDPLRIWLKHFIVNRLKPRHLKAEMITDDEPLVGGRVAFDSLDALELFVGLEEELGIDMVAHEEARDALVSVAALAAWIRRRQKLSLRQQFSQPSLRVWV